MSMAGFYHVPNPGNQMRSFIAAVHLFAGLYIGAMLYRPAPAMTAPVKAASWLKTYKAQDRVPKRCDTPHDTRL